MKKRKPSYAQQRAIIEKQKQRRPKDIAATIAFYQASRGADETTKKNLASANLHGCNKATSQKRRSDK